MIASFTSPRLNGKILNRHLLSVCISPQLSCASATSSATRSRCGPSAVSSAGLWHSVETRTSVVLIWILRLGLGLTTAEGRPNRVELWKETKSHICMPNGMRDRSTAKDVSRFLAFKRFDPKPIFAETVDAELRLHQN
jgi:hypothetical protein